MSETANAHLTITTMFCDESKREILIRRRSTGIRWYVNRLVEAVTGKGFSTVIPEKQNHIILVTTVERDPETQEVIRTYHSGLFGCPHDENEEVPHGEHR